MGFYIQGPAKGKANVIIEHYEGRKANYATAKAALDSDLHCPIIILDNGSFEAAGFAFDMKEFEAFTDPRDLRPRTFLIMPRKLAETLTGFDPEDYV